MPSKRKPIKRAAKRRITPEAVALLRRIVEIQEAGDTWEEQGGRRREMLDATRELGAAHRCRWRRAADG
jgi:hypothetical protein